MRIVVVIDPRIGHVAPSERAHHVHRVHAPRPTRSRSSVDPSGACKASWYARGTWTASGERFDPDGFTAAHRTLAFGTRLRVVELDRKTFRPTGDEVTVRITDRGPAAWTGKCIDLARGAFGSIAPLGSGWVYVTWKVLA